MSKKNKKFSPDSGSLDQVEPDNNEVNFDSEQKDNVQRDTSKNNKKQTRRTSNNSNQNKYDKFRPYVQRNGKYFTTKNFSMPVVALQFTNQSLISGAIVEGQCITIRYTIVVKKSRLEAQASVWANRIISEHRLYLKSILNVYPNQYEEVLIKLYIYSYFRCVLYAINDRRVVDLPLNQVNIAGHAILRHCLLVSSHTFTHDQVTIQYLLDISDEEYDAILEMAQTYPYINDYLRTSPRFYIENAELDRCFDALYRDTNMTDGPKLFRQDKDTNQILSSLTRDKFPILNSIYKHNGDENQWFYAYTEEERLTDGSMLFGKACFITEKDESVIRNYFSSVTVDDNYRMTKYEVSSITGTWYPEYIVKQGTTKK